MGTFLTPRSIAAVHIAWLLSDRGIPRGRAGTRRTGAQLGVYSLVDLRADPIDRAFCDRVVMVAAKFVMCCCGSDLVPDGLTSSE
jgi:hypothetical protein